MRKHHNKLYYGQYPCKVEFSFPGWATTLWPTTDHNLRDVSNNNANADMLIDLANFILEHRGKLKFRIQEHKTIFYCDKELEKKLIDILLRIFINLFLRRHIHVKNNSLLEILK